MDTDLRSPSPPTSSLNDRIKEAGDQIRNRRRLVRVRGAALGRTLHQRMTAPAMLLLAGGLGFLAGALTRRQTPRSRGADRSPDSGQPLFESALNLIKLVNWGHSLFALPPGARTRPRGPSIPSRQHHPKGNQHANAT